MEEIIFPNQIRMIRRTRGKSMQELADFLGVSLSAVSKIEKGYRRIDQEQLVRIADFLSCPIQDVFVNEATSQPDVLQAWKREQDRRNNVNERNGLKVLGAGLRHLRTQKSMTLSEVAENASMTLSVYHRIEMGQREVSEKEFLNISSALGMKHDDLVSGIYELNKNGSLDEYIQRADTRNKGLPGSLSALASGEAVPTQKEGTLPVYGKPADDGMIEIDRNEATGDITCPSALAKAVDAYGLNLCTRRLGALLPTRSVLLVDPNQTVGVGDIAVYFETGTSAKLISVKEDTNGNLIGLRFNPDEKIELNAKTLAALHRVVFISIP